ncbi:hypothetical protein TeGR_g1194, partial [Tetraparma gracilis]
TAMEKNDYSEITSPPAAGDDLDAEAPVVEDVPTADDTAAFCILEKLHVSFNQLERSLQMYEAGGGCDNAEPLTFAALPVVEEVVEAAPAPAPGMSAAAAIADAPGAANEAPAELVDPAAAVYEIPELASLGRAFRSTASTALTESETEYVVTVVKHIFDAHVVLQFSVLNTI